MEEEEENEESQKYAMAFIGALMLGVLVLLFKLVGLI